MSDFEREFGGDLIAMHDGSILATHGPSECGKPCPIHAPSDHHMVSWPQHWRADRGIMERICPHGVGHPDRDDLLVRSGQGHGIHGCDGCCRTPDGEKT